jgi:hypothetical protein
VVEEHHLLRKPGPVTDQGLRLPAHATVAGHEQRAAVADDERGLGRGGIDLPEIAVIKLAVPAGGPGLSGQPSS